MGHGRWGCSLGLLSAGCLQGHSPLETLQQWVKLYCQDLDIETREKAGAMERLLQAASTGRGKEGPLLCLRTLLPSPAARWALIPKGMSCSGWWGGVGPGMPHGGLRFPTAPHSPLASQALLRDHLFDPEASPSSSPCPGPPEACQARARVSQASAAPPVARPGRSRHKLAASSSSEDEASTGAPRPTQKRPRHSAPAQQAKARVAGHTSDREVAAAGAGRAAYRAAIRGVGSARSCRLESGPCQGPGEAPPLQAALIPEEECLAGDWLEDDLLVTAGRRGSRQPQPQGRGHRTWHRVSGSSSDESSMRPRARQSRLPRHGSPSALGRAAGDCCSATERPQSPGVPSVERPTEGQPPVGAKPGAEPAAARGWRAAGHRAVFPDQPVPPLPSARGPPCSLPSGCAFASRTVSSSSLSHTGKALPAPSQPQLPLRPCGL